MLIWQTAFSSIIFIFAIKIVKKVEYFCMILYHLAIWGPVIYTGKRSKIHLADVFSGWKMALRSSTIINLVEGVHDFLPRGLTTGKKSDKWIWKVSTGREWFVFTISHALQKVFGIFSCWQRSEWSAYKWILDNLPISLLPLCELL